MGNTTIDELKSKVDIITIAELYGEWTKSGNNYTLKGDKSVVVNAHKQIFSNFNGSVTGGSVIDLIVYFENCELREAINKLKEFAGHGSYDYTPQKQKERQKEAKKSKFTPAQIEQFSKNDLKQKHKPILIETDEGSYLMIHEHYKKLFETPTLPIEATKKINYLYSHLLGFDEFFQCPSIIIYDGKGKIVDKVSYRPNRPEKIKAEDWKAPKYIYKNQSNRGKDFLYPFQKELEPIIKREGYVIIGEGIKNALNALVYSAPFISLESTTTQISDELKNYILKLKNKGTSIICCFDGDKAGEKAYQKFIEHTGITAVNVLNFTSNVDFIEYLMEDVA